jgi:phage shock protein E
MVDAVNRGPGTPVEGVDAERAHALASKGNALIVDVREPEEWAEARIPGAVHVPLGELASRVSELPGDRPLIMQCRSGNRSRTAAKFLKENGFTDVVNLEGGIKDWADADLPLER